MAGVPATTDAPLRDAASRSAAELLHRRVERRLLHQVADDARGLALREAPVDEVVERGVRVARQRGLRRGLRSAGSLAHPARHVAAIRIVVVMVVIGFGPFMANRSWELADRPGNCAASRSAAARGVWVKSNASSRLPATPSRACALRVRHELHAPQLLDELGHARLLGVALEHEALLRVRRDDDERQAEAAAEPRAVVGACGPAASRDRRSRPSHPT